MLIPSLISFCGFKDASLSRRVNANSQLVFGQDVIADKLIKKGEC